MTLGALRRGARTGSAEVKLPAARCGEGDLRIAKHASTCGEVKEHGVPLARSPREVRSQRAFTLIEIAMVVFILSLVALLTFPRLHRWTGGDARSAARELAGLVDALVQESVASHTMFRLHYDLGAHTFWVTSLTQTGGVLEEGAPRGAVRPLPADVRFRDVATPHQGLMTEGDAFTQFFPSGRATRTTIHLTEGDHVSTLVINPISGRLSVRDGDFEDRRS